MKNEIYGLIEKINGIVNGTVVFVNDHCVDVYIEGKKTNAICVFPYEEINASPEELEKYKQKTMKTAFDRLMIIHERVCNANGVNN